MRGFLAEFEHLFRGAGGEHVHDAGDDPRPAGLVAGPEAGPVVAVEILVEQHEIAPVRVFLELPGSAIDRPPALLVLEKGVRQAARDLFGDLIQVHVPPGARGTLDGEIISIEGVIIHQGPNDQDVDRHPDRSAPVGVAAEHAGIGFRRQIPDTIFLAAGMET